MEACRTRIEDCFFCGGQGFTRFEQPCEVCEGLGSVLVVVIDELSVDGERFRGVIWTSLKYLRRSGGASGPGWFLHFSAISSSGSRDNREDTPVMVQKGGE